MSGRDQLLYGAATWVCFLRKEEQKNPGLTNQKFPQRAIIKRQASTKTDGRDEVFFPPHTQTKKHFEGRLWQKSRKSI